MNRYYLDVNPAQFNQDLSDKDGVIMLYADGALRGFSTWMLFEHECAGQSVSIMFSGDTITDQDYRGSLALPIAGGQLMLKKLSEHTGKVMFWMLTTKGYRTYRFLPVFFRAFYPSCRHGTPDFEISLLESLARMRFDSRFNAETCVLTAPDRAQRLRPGIDDVPPARLKDEHVAFFTRQNPGYARGDELVCLARCDRDNVRPSMLRRLLR
jgi:hypothetical protein